MGALTDNRKRCLIDHHHRFPSPPLADLSCTPPSKKPKIFSSPPPHNPSPPPHNTSPPPPMLPSFPPPSPLSRPIHAPQRILKAFGLGSSRRPPPRLDGPDAEIHNLIRAKKPASSPVQESLGLEEYKRLVVDVQEARSTVGTRESEELSEAPPVSELTVVTRESEEVSDLYVLDRKVEEGGKVVLESTPVREGSLAVRRSGTPLYKELYEVSLRKSNPKLSNLEFEVKVAEKKLLSFRVVREMQLKKPREDLREPFAPLTDEEEHTVNHALHGGRRHEVLVIHESSNIEITREVLQCLSYGAWLNDEVINVYLELLKERERREPKKFLNCHFFSSFFYKKLISGKNGYDFKSVRRWTSQRKLGYNLIECDKIFVPIHKEVHWCLAVIHVKDERFQYLDSLGGMDTTVLRVLARYLMDEVKDKSGKQIDTASWRQETLEDLPLQKNGWDCGMFMLKYADFYSRGVSLSFSQEHMEYFRKRTIKEILRLRAE